MLVTVEEAAVRRVMNGKAFVEMTTLMNGKTGEMLEVSSSHLFSLILGF